MPVPPAKGAAEISLEEHSGVGVGVGVGVGRGVVGADVGVGVGVGVGVRVGVKLAVADEDDDTGRRFLRFKAPDPLQVMNKIRSDTITKTGKKNFNNRRFLFLFCIRLLEIL
jgi:hypothetical protein